MKNNFISFICLISFILLVQSNVEIEKLFRFPLATNGPFDTLIDNDEGFVYLVDYMNTGNSQNSILFKFDMNTLELIDALNLGVMYAEGAAIDTVNKFIYAETYGNNPIVQIAKVDLKKFEVVDIITLDISVSSGSWKAQIDIINQKGYFGCYYPPFVVKIDLTTFTQEANLSLSQVYIGDMIIDIPNGFLYAVTDSDTMNNQTLSKIALSNFSIIDTLILNSSSDLQINFGGIYNSTQKMYLATYQSPMTVVIIDLINFTKQETITFQNLSECHGMGIDETNEIGYFVDQNGVIGKMNLTNNSLIDTLNTTNGTSNADSIGFDFETQKAYVATGGESLIEIDLSLFQVENINTMKDYSDPKLFLIDESNQIAYFQFLNSSNIIFKFDLESLQIIDNLTSIYQFNFGEIGLLNQIVYLFPNSLNGLNIEKLNLSTFSFQGINQIHNNGTIKGIDFNEEKGILYIGYLNKNNLNYEIIQINVTNLSIINNSSFGNETNFININIDDISNEYLYLLYSNISDSNYYLSKINLSNMNIINYFDFEDTFFEYFFEMNYQYFYFQNSSNNLISRINLSNMIIMNDSLNISSFQLYSTYLELNDNSINLIGSFPDSIGYFNPISILQVNLSSNQLISNLSTEYSFSSLINEYDSSKSINYILNNDQKPYSLYQFNQPTPTPTPSPSPTPSSSQQILFSILIYTIIIFGLF
ncbi:protein nirf [Anaeramoeba ignava]|uniref:Protein nirf n=1 Tax=Anaeramoeba ignava TaxID=1746090 RepID=A0A9Q0RA84_ANAIG|nr:protein nirf [Anaeramoeba ignava]